MVFFIIHYLPVYVEKCRLFIFDFYRFYRDEIISNGPHDFDPECETSLCHCIVVDKLTPHEVMDEVDPFFNTGSSHGPPCSCTHRSVEKASRCELKHFVKTWWFDNVMEQE